jgi:hypothetical protein
VNFFGTQDSNPDALQDTDTDEVLSKLDSALTTIFTESGKRTVIYYMTNKYGLTLEQAIKDPSKLEKALTSMLGEVGWMVVKRAILEEFWAKKISISDTVIVQRASLHDAFGFVRGFGVGSFIGPK